MNILELKKTAIEAGMTPEAADLYVTAMPDENRMGVAELKASNPLTVRILQSIAPDMNRMAAFEFAPHYQG